MPQYRAREPIYLNSSGRLVDTGEVFASDEVPGLAWELIESEQPVATARSGRNPASAGK